MIKKYLFIFFLFGHGLSNTLEAAHLIGGELTYTCVGNNNYKVQLIIYRDCFSSGANFDNPAIIGVYIGTNLFQRIELPFTQSVTIPYNTPNPCASPPPSLCAEYMIYDTVLALPPHPMGYDLVHQRCCRNPTINNLILPGETGNSYLASIPPNDTFCNSSPSFPSLPPLVLCQNVSFSHNNYAIDSDGDSLVYSLCSPFHGGGMINDPTSPFSPKPDPPLPPPFPLVNFSAGHSAAAPITGNPPLSINPATGMLNGVPNVAGQYVVTVCVSEFRNGQFISKVYRDYQFNVYNCDLTFLATIRAQSTFNLPPCNGLTVNFQSYTTGASSWSWKFNDPGNAPNDVSNLQNPTYTFSDTGVYNVRLIINEGTACTDTTFELFAVYLPVNPDFEMTGSKCENDLTQTFTYTGATLNATAWYYWNFGPAANPPFYEGKDPPLVTFASPGPHTISLQIEANGCVDSIQKTLEFFKLPSFDAQATPLEVCVGEDVDFINYSESETPMFTQWDFGDGNTSSATNAQHFYSAAGTYFPSVKIRVPTGCADSTQLFLEPIVVNPLPGVVLKSNKIRAPIYFPDFEFDIEISGNYTRTIFYAGDGSTYQNQKDIKHEYSADGFYWAVAEAENEFGCIGTDSLLIEVFPEVNIYVPNIFSPNGDGTNETFKVVATGLLDYRIDIFNQWGGKVFESTELNEGWDGTYGNEKSPIGVYVYYIYATSIFEEKLARRGQLLLVR